MRDAPKVRPLAHIAPPRADLYSTVVPLEDPSTDAWTLFRAGQSSTRRHRWSFRYFALRVSALLLAVAGVGSTWGLVTLGLPETALPTALRLVAYAAWVLALPALFQLIRRLPEPRAKKKRSVLLRIIVLVALSLVVLPALVEVLTDPSQRADNLSGLVLVGLLLFVPQALWSTFRALRSRKAIKANQNSQTPSPPIEELNPTPNDVPSLGARLLGLWSAIFLLSSAGVLPGIIAALYWSGASLGGGAEWSPLLYASLYLALLALAGSVVGTLAERIAPRWPRLVATLLIFGPFAVSLFWFDCPNLIEAFTEAFRWMLRESSSLGLL